jgi:hypothetical protein
MTAPSIARIVTSPARAATQIPVPVDRAGSTDLSIAYDASYELLFFLLHILSSKIGPITEAAVKAA